MNPFLLLHCMFDQIAQQIPYQHIQYKNINITVKRLDRVHPHISGNKFFKLKYNLLAAQQMRMTRLLTFGGAYSNHIAATAYAAHLFGFTSVGIIRGEELANKPLNPTLSTAEQFGMRLVFVNREVYRQRLQDEYLNELRAKFPEHYVIPEGGTNTLAIQGCKEILSDQDQENFDVICCAVGTGGTIAGIIEASLPHQQVLGFSALKGDFLQQEVAMLLSQPKCNWNVIDDYCQGGYAKTTSELIQFIKDFEQIYAIPLEHIYTAKLFFGLFNLIDQQHFHAHTKILVMHTGGLQGRLASF